MKALLIGLAFAFPPSALCADNLEYAIVTGVESLQRVRTASSLFPWDRAAPDEVLVSLSCGFVQVVYERVTTPKIARLDDDYKTRPWTAFVHLGHYCKLNEFVLDGWHLVAYRKWKGKDYLISYAEIRVGEDKRLHVDDSGLSSRTQASRAFRVLPHRLATRRIARTQGPNARTAGSTWTTFRREPRTFPRSVCTDAGDRSE